MYTDSSLEGIHTMDPVLWQGRIALFKSHESATVVAEVDWRILEDEKAGFDPFVCFEGFARKMGEYDLEWTLFCFFLFLCLRVFRLFLFWWRRRMLLSVFSDEVLELSVGSCLFIDAGHNRSLWYPCFWPD